MKDLALKVGKTIVLPQQGRFLDLQCPGKTDVLNNFRQRLSIYRKSAAPIASFVDFALWSVRVGLPPWGLKFWLVFGFIFGGLLFSILLPSFMILALILTILFGGQVLLMLVLSYVRTMMNAQYSLIEQSNDQMAGRLSLLSDRPLHRSSSNLNSNAFAANIISEIMGSKFFETLAEGHDSLQSDITILNEKLAVLDKQFLEVTDLRAELSNLARRTERQLRLESNAISQLTSHIELLEGNLSGNLAKTAKRRSTRKTSA